MLTNAYRDDQTGFRPPAILPAVKAIRVDRRGGPEVLELKDWDAKNPGPGEALVRVQAIGVNFIDV
jgi:D-arabinose 1-dehydrogenase-like Zn-dependent alcohol dehydrogenase